MVRLAAALPAVHRLGDFAFAASSIGTAAAACSRRAVRVVVVVFATMGLEREGGRASGRARARPCELLRRSDRVTARQIVVAAVPISGRG